MTGKPRSATVKTTDAPPQEKPGKGMVNPETGVSPAPVVDGAVTDGARATTAASPLDPARNGQPAELGTDTTGEMRAAGDAPATAATGGTTGNGIPTGTAKMLERGHGGNGDSTAKLENDGVRAETGSGTGAPPAAEEGPVYPSTTLTRSSSRAAPTEPADVRTALLPALGDTATSTDPTAAAATIQSHAGDETVDLVNSRGESVKPSEFFSVPDGPRGAGIRVVTMRVSEVYTVRHVKNPSRRLLFTEGQEVPAATAETLIELHG